MEKGVLEIVIDFWNKEPMISCHTHKDDANIVDVSFSTTILEARSPADYAVFSELPRLRDAACGPGRRLLQNRGCDLLSRHDSRIIQRKDENHVYLYVGAEMDGGVVDCRMRQAVSAG